MQSPYWTDTSSKTILGQPILNWNKNLPDGIWLQLMTKEHIFILAFDYKEK